MVKNIKEGSTESIPEELRDNRIVYHCGPVVMKEDKGWRIYAAGPTTSSRFTDDAAFLFEKGIFKVAIGKGTMGANAKNAIRGKGVFLSAVGGCAVTYTKMIHQADVKWIDLGYPEAMWIFKVVNFGPLIVSIDSKGKSLTEKVMGEVYENARKIFREEGLDPNLRYVQYPQTFAGLSLEEVIDKCKRS
jgi:fumarate hydratase subunit beta